MVVIPFKGRSLVMLGRSSNRALSVPIGLFALLLIAVGGVVAVGSLSSSFHADCTQQTATTADAAALVAVACDTEVEVIDERSPWVTVYARPDGASRMVVDAVAQHTNVNGVWEPVDPSIAESPRDEPRVSTGGGGRNGLSMSHSGQTSAALLSPSDVDDMLPVRAAVFPIWLNPGGSAGQGLPLGVVERDDSWVKLWFPLDLPTATVDGRFLTYELAAGVRLMVAVVSDGSGFRPIVELDSLKAAQWFQDALDEAREVLDLPGEGYEIPYRVESSAGLQLRGVDDVGFELVDTAENVVFWSPPSLMWDSGADEGVDGPAERVEFPVPGDRTTAMQVRVTDVDEVGGVVVVAPDEQMLESSSTVWPVRVDPSLGGRTPAEWIAVRTGGFTGSIYKWTDTSTRVGESMGYCSMTWTSACGTTFTSRLVWEFRDSLGTNSLASWMNRLVGADITSASFTADPGQRGNCTSSRTDAWHTDSIVEGQSKWSSLSFSIYLSKVTAPQGDACSDAGVRRGWNVTSAVVSAANANPVSIALGLKANNETTSSGYKTYKNNARLEIIYNRAPNTPTNVKMHSPSMACASGVSRPLITTATPTLSALVTDPDGGTVRAQFQVLNTSDQTEVWNSGNSTPMSSGSTFTATVPSGKLVSGGTYRYRVSATDNFRSSGWSAANCEFSVDTEKPAAPSITPVRAGVSAIYDANVERGGLGLTGTFTLSRDSSADVVSFRYSFNNTTLSQTATPDSSGTVAISFTPTMTGPVALRVLSRDAAGNDSSTTTHVFDVAESKEDAVWMFDESSGAVASDSSGQAPARDLAIFGASRGDGPHDLFGSRPGDRALIFDGVDDQAATGPVVDTKGSFVISAYVWLDAEMVETGRFTAISQDGIHQSGFELSYLPSCSGMTGGCWSFAMRNTDSTNAGTTAVTSSVPVVGDQWAHLVAEHDIATEQITVWACEIGTPESPGKGEPIAESASRTAAPWTSAGGFVVGRGLSDAAPTAWWPGQIDNIRVFEGEVVADQKIRRMCQGAEARDFTTGLEALDPTAEEGQ